MNNLAAAKRALFWFGLLKVPLIFLVRPRIELISEHECCISIRKRWLTSNHLGSLYLGVFSIGADVCAGFLAYYIASKHQYKLSLAFKSLNIEFIRRGEKRVYFKTDSGDKIKNMLDECAQSKERITRDIRLIAYEIEGEEQITLAEGSIGLSLKIKAS